MLKDAGRINGMAQRTRVAAASARNRMLSALKRESRKDRGDVYTETDVRSERHDIEAESNGRIKERTVDVDGLKVNYIEAGAGEKCILLIHGGVNNDAYSTWFKWNRTIDVLSERYKVVAMDLPGYGLSDMPKTCTQDYYVDFVRDFTERLGIEKANVVGTSMGGGLALGYSLRYSERVDSQILISPYGLGFSLPRSARIILRIIPPSFVEKGMDFLDKHREFTKKALGLLFGNGAESMLKAIDGMSKDRMREAFLRFISGEAFTLRGLLLGKRAGMRTDYTDSVDRLNDTNVRTLFIQGEDDTIVRLENVRRIAGRLRNASIDVVRDCKHSPHFREPERVNRDIVDFVENGGIQAR